MHTLQTIGDPNWILRVKDRYIFGSSKCVESVQLFAKLLSRESGSQSEPNCAIVESRRESLHCVLLRQLPMSKRPPSSERRVRESVSYVCLLSIVDSFDSRARMKTHKVCVLAIYFTCLITPLLAAAEHKESEEVVTEILQGADNVTMHVKSRRKFCPIPAIDNFQDQHLPPNS